MGNREMKKNQEPPKTLPKEKWEEVEKFAKHMTDKLNANLHKPGWRGDLFKDLLRRLEEEVKELRDLTLMLDRQPRM